MKTIETFQKNEQNIPTRPVTTAYVRDGVGNVIRQVSPRAWDTCPQPGGCDPGPSGEYVTEYWYDEADREVRIDLPRRGTPPRTYIHEAYDKNGNLTMTSLPVASTDPPPPGSDKRTDITYWDTGSIRTIDNNVDKKVAFDYDPEGRQTSRFTPRRQGSLMTWEYYPDGTLKRAVDRDGQDTNYWYDLDNNPIRVTNTQGQGQSPRGYEVQSTYNGFDEATKTREQNEQQQNWTFTAYGYDRSGNVLSREDDGEEQEDHTLVERGRLNLFTYDWVDEETRQDDLGTDWQPPPPDPQPSLGDRRLERTYDKRGWQTSETLSRYEASSWAAKRATTWTYFANGDLATLTAEDGQEPNPTVLEQHSLAYEQVVNGRPVYVNGNRTSDSFTLHGPPGPPPQPTACETTCTTTYKYGVRENLTGETRVHGASTTANCYAFDEAMNVTDEWELTEACPDTGPPSGPRRRHFVYPLGNRLTQMTENPDASPVVHSYFHDDDGNLECVTVGPGTASDCPDPYGAPVPANLEERFTWHYPNRLKSYRKYGDIDVLATYQHDPFDRLVYEKEEREGQPDRVTTFIYQGLTSLVSSETSGGEQKSYTYDASGQLVAMISGAGSPPTAEYGYGANVHTDVSLLLNLVNDQVYASYGYKAYGATDGGLTRVDDDPVNPISPYRFNAKRYDPGSTTLAMGARRYSNSDLGRFIQQDFLTDSSADIDLATEIPTQNRYVFAASNPVDFLETDGHSFAVDTGGGCKRVQNCFKIVRKFKPPCAAQPGYPLSRIGWYNGGVAAHEAKDRSGNWQSRNAVDLNVPMWTKVCAIYRGWISKSLGFGGSDKCGGSGGPKMQAHGLRLHLNRTGGRRAFYQHLRAIVVRCGEEIEKGQLLGYTGCEGSAHLHLALWPYTKRNNPERIFPYYGRPAGIPLPSGKPTKDEPARTFEPCVPPPYPEPDP